MAKQKKHWLDDTQKERCIRIFNRFVAKMDDEAFASDEDRDTFKTHLWHLCDDMKNQVIDKLLYDTEYIKNKGNN